MNHSDFAIGETFWCGGRQWRCTDIGTRVIVAIRIDQIEVGSSVPELHRTLSGIEAEADGWFNGPPYAVMERVFDEDTMQDCTAKASDEQFALGLLKDFLANCGEAGCRCEINVDDPPDLVVTRENGEHWGIEVTRVYQQVEEIRKGAGAPKRVSSETVYVQLNNFAERLGQETANLRGRGYALFLEGPGLFSRWNNRLTLNNWKDEVARTVRKFVASGQDGRCDFLPRGSGNIRTTSRLAPDWEIYIGYPAVELLPARSEALYRALADKAQNLRNWKADFPRKFLLLLNCFVLADNPNEVKVELSRLVGDRPECRGFDGIFWSGYPERRLIPFFPGDSSLLGGGG